MDNLWTSRSPGPGQLKLPNSDEEYQISGVFVSGSVRSPGRDPVNTEKQNGGNQPFIFLLTKAGQPGMMLQPGIAGRKRR